MMHPLGSGVAERFRAVAVAAVVLLAASGCHYPPALKTYEYVATYERMTGIYEPLLSLVYVPRTTCLKAYRGIVIGDFGVGRHWVEAPEEAAGYARFFRIVLLRELLKLNKFEFVSLSMDAEALPPGSLDDALLLEGMITGLDTGSGLMRYLSYFLWFLQSGATDFQVEGRIMEARSGRLVAEFVDRRRHLCNTPFGPNPHNFDDQYAMKVTARTTAECLARFIEMGCEKLPAAAADARANGGAESKT